MATNLQPVHADEDEQALVASARAGDLAAFERIVERYERRIFRLVRRMLGDEADAEDVLQETFIKVYTKLDQFQQQSKIYTWIVRIAVNQALMKLRQRRGHTVSLDENPEDEHAVPLELSDLRPDPEQQYQASETSALLQRALESLSWPYRVVFQLRDIEELSTEETADVLGLSTAAVKSRLLRARLQLRQRLARHLRPEGA